MPQEPDKKYELCGQLYLNHPWWGKSVHSNQAENNTFSSFCFSLSGGGHDVYHWGWFSQSPQDPSVCLASKVRSLPSTVFSTLSYMDVSQVSNTTIQCYPWTSITGSNVCRNDKPSHWPPTEGRRAKSFICINPSSGLRQVTNSADIQCHGSPICQYTFFIWSFNKSFKCKGSVNDQIDTCAFLSSIALLSFGLWLPWTQADLSWPATSGYFPWSQSPVRVNLSGNTHVWKHQRSSINFSPSSLARKGSTRANLTASCQQIHP